MVHANFTGDVFPNNLPVLGSSKIAKFSETSYLWMMRIVPSDCYSGAVVQRGGTSRPPPGKEQRLVLVLTVMAAALVWVTKS